MSSGLRGISNDAEAVVLNPYQPYALMLIQRLYDNYGVRTVCLHTDWRTRFLLEGRFPLLRSPAVSAHYMVKERDWASIARHLRARHHVAGVLPFEEGMVQPMSVLAGHLDLPWSQPAVLPAFRDKHALKQLIHRADPTIRLNVNSLVRSLADVKRITAQEDLTRFVLKPNSGSGNHNVAFFDRGSPDYVIRDYLRESSDDTLLEEFVNGPEFWVNGQMDADGQPTVVGVGQYLRVDKHEVRNLEVGSFAVSPADPVFPVLRDYAERVMRATGLRRSPFHLEAIVDESGPCLVEVGARLCGELGVLLDMTAHGVGLDLIDVAAHYYVSDRPYGALALNWPRVALGWVGTATGDSAVTQRLVRVEGLDSLQDSEHFLFWIKQPRPGDFVQHTRNLTTRAWSVALRGDKQSPAEVIEWARQSVTLRGTADKSWTLRQRWPMYRGVIQKAWSARPRPYEAKALIAG